jgi:nucleotide-binding universal stress UspA family protein
LRIRKRTSARPTENGSIEPEAAMKILLAVDGSDYTKRMLDYLAAHDELLGASHEYTALTVVTPIPPHAARHLDRQTVDSYYRDEAAKVLDAVVAVASQRGWKLTALFRPGHAAEEIAGLAEREAFDLVVMGTHGHSALGSLVLGSVASGVLARAKKPILLVP